jgi:D-alanyl-lipoteichoic acid acyltransferase DltB (MBOAT superfamily)
MAFASYEFLVFFFILFVLYWLFPNRRWQNLLLLASSAIFYGWLAPWHVLVLFIAIVVDYFLALGMARWKSRSGVLMWLGVILNIALLAFIKYYLFIDEPLAGFLTGLGLRGDLFVSIFLLPLGVSFYVLKKISYLIEVQRGSMQPERDFIAFAAYVSFFPQVFSGPIERPQKFLAQLGSPRVWSGLHFYNAWVLIVMGFFKKIVIADTVKVFVDQIFLMQEPSKGFLIVGALGFTLQILTDFSSYTDLSRGFAFLLGLQTAENFNKPYLALTPGEFWNRWHMSFSFWLRDYAFFPLRRMLLKAKNIPEFVSQVIPPLVTMFISGLWHGTGLTFIAWGLYYGILIVAYQFADIRGDWKPANPIGRFFAWVVMFTFIVFGWAIFRAVSLPWLWNTLAYAPLHRSPDDVIASFILLVMIGFYASLLLVKHILDRFAPEREGLHALYYTAATLLTVVFINSTSPDFIYFQF